MDGAPSHQRHKLQSWSEVDIGSWEVPVSLGDRDYLASRGFLGSGRSTFQCLLCEASQPSSPPASWEPNGKMVNLEMARWPP